MIRLSLLGRSVPFSLGFHKLISGVAPEGRWTPQDRNLSLVHFAYDVILLVTFFTIRIPSPACAVMTLISSENTNCPNKLVGPIVTNTKAVIISLRRPPLKDTLWVFRLLVWLECFIKAILCKDLEWHSRDRGVMMAETPLMAPAAIKANRLPLVVGDGGSAKDYPYQRLLRSPLVGSPNG